VRAHGSPSKPVKAAAEAPPATPPAPPSENGKGNAYGKQKNSN
jgi:hypothetical protein